MSVATDRQLSEIAEWLRAEMIQTGNRRYIDFLERNPSAEVHPCVGNTATVGFVMIDGHRIAMVAFKPGEERWTCFMAGGVVGWASRTNLAALSVQTSDAGERAFWAERGFVAVSANSLLLDPRGEIDLTPFTGKKTEFSIRFYSEGRSDVEPYAVTEGVGILTELRELHLPRRAICIQQADVQAAPASRTVVEIEVGAS